MIWNRVIWNRMIWQSLIARALFRLRPKDLLCS
jgi:hypothetical protein